MVKYIRLGPDNCFIRSDFSVHPKTLTADEMVAEKIMLDIEILRFIWWVLLGVLFMGFAVTDGFDLGAAALLPFVARNETERRIVLNTIGPVWEGNQVWIILGRARFLLRGLMFMRLHFLVLILLY